MDKSVPPVRRRRQFVDSRVQGALVARAISYWLFCLLTITLMLLCWRIITLPPQMFYRHLGELWLQFGAAILASLLMLPLVLLDVVRLSNRFAGPLVRLRRAMRALARGDQVQPLKFRDGDYWQDFADDFNSIAAGIQRSRAASTKTVDEYEPELEEYGESVGAAADSLEPSPA